MTNRDLIRKMKMKKNLIGGLVASILGLAFVISGCDSTRHESTKGVVEPADASVGDIVVFGDIRWYVIAKTDTGYTLLSEKPVIKQAFRKSGYGISTVTWEEYTVRAWLNEDFYNSKFCDGEKAAIVTSHNTYVEDDYHYESDCGNDTDDKVYIFSYSEALAVSDDTRDCGIDWWVRTPGKYQYDAMYIGLSSPNTIGNSVDNHMAVRPAIRVRYSGKTVD